MTLCINWSKWVWEKSFPLRFVTLFYLFKKKKIKKGQQAKAAKIRSDFKVSETKYWWIKVKALGELKDWEQVFIFFFFGFFFWIFFFWSDFFDLVVVLFAVGEILKREKKSDWISSVCWGLHSIQQLQGSCQIHPQGFHFLLQQKKKKQNRNHKKKFRFPKPNKKLICTSKSELSKKQLTSQKPQKMLICFPKFDQSNFQKSFPQKKNSHFPFFLFWQKMYLTSRNSKCDW